MDPTPPPANDPNAPAGFAGKYTRQQWLDMQAKAIAAGDLDNAKVFEQMASEWKATDKERAQNNQQLETDMAALERADPYSLGNLAGAAFEPNATMLSGAVTTPVAGLFGLGKGAVINPLMRAFGGQPNDAADLVRSIQDWTYKPQTAGGQTALGAIGAPWTAAHEHIAEPSGRYVEETFAKHGDPGGGAVLGTAAEVIPDAVAQLFGGELLGRATNFSPRNVMAAGARRLGMPETGWQIERKPPNRDVVELARAGVVTTPGQRAAQSPRDWVRQLGRFEELMMRNPFFGAHIRHARERGVEEMNYGQLNDARIPMGLKPIRHGEMAPEDAIIQTNDELSDKYEDFLPRLQGDAYMPLDASQPRMAEGVRNWARIQGAEAKFMADKYGWPGSEEHTITPEERAQVRAQLGIDPNAPITDPSSLPAATAGTAPTFISQMSDILTTARDGKKGKSDLIRLTSDADKTTLANLIEAIHNRMTEPERLPDGSLSVGGKFDGFDLKTIATWISSAKKVALAARRQGGLSGQLVPYLERLQQSFRAMINAANPGAAAELQRHDMAWSQLKLVEDAFTARGGDVKPYFTPAAGEAAVRRKALAKPEGKRLLAQGQAQGQRLAGAASRVLGNKVRGESPTAEALMALGETTADVATSGIDPATGLLGSVATGVLGNILGQRLIYGRGMQKWMQDNYLRGHANLPFTDIPAGGAFARGLPTAIGGEERAREDMDAQMRAQLQELGVNPDVMRQ